VRTIVVGYDGSDHAGRALDRAIELAAQGAELVVVSAAGLAPETDPTFLLTTASANQDEQEAARASLAEARARAVGGGVAVRTLEAHGDPADMLVQVAAEERADLVVVGTRGLNLAQRALLGSVSTKVVHDAPCDVLVVR
jgi:nucleotide-binding universal stress UspA family protein